MCGSAAVSIKEAGFFFWCCSFCMQRRLGLVTGSGELANNMEVVVEGSDDGKAKKRLRPGEEDQVGGKISEKK